MSERSVGWYGVPTLLLVAAASSACVVARIPQALDRTGTASDVGDLLSQAGSTGTLVYEESGKGCSIPDDKWILYGHGCSHWTRALYAVPGSDTDAQARFDEILTLGGLNGCCGNPPDYYHREADRLGARLFIGTALDRLSNVKERAALEGARRELAPAETIVALHLSYRTPMDYIRTHPCFVPRFLCWIPH